MEKKRTVGQKIDALTVVVEKGFAAVADNIADIRRMMATKEDLNDLRDEVRRELRDIPSELQDISGRLDVLDEHYKIMRGFATEIDELRSRISNIENHLGINKKIAA